MSRTIVVGDVHGCADELDTLLDRVAFTTGDRLVFVGDLVARGPKSREVLDIVRRTGALMVRGNHEERLLEGRERIDRRLRSRIHTDVARSLRDDHWHLLELAPYALELPEHKLAIVHAGVVPGIPFHAQKKEALLRMRTLDSRGRPDEKHGPRLWGTVYRGPPHIVFGHNANGLPQFHVWATGIDTGCVYGGKLTAIVLQQGESMARGTKVRGSLVSVRARHEYYASGRVKRVA